MFKDEAHDNRHWLAEIFEFRGSVFPLVAPKILVLSTVAWIVTWIENREGLPQLPMAPFTVLGTALGLLLTLRTNTSYDRFWEGRKAWGSMVNRCRNLARQAAQFFPDPAADGTSPASSPRLPTGRSASCGRKVPCRSSSGSFLRRPRPG